MSTRDNSRAFGSIRLYRAGSNSTNWRSSCANEKPMKKTYHNHESGQMDDGLYKNGSDHSYCRTNDRVNSTFRSHRDGSSNDNWMNSNDKSWRSTSHSYGRILIENGPIKSGPYKSGPNDVNCNSNGRVTDTTRCYSDSSNNANWRRSSDKHSPWKSTSNGHDSALIESIPIEKRPFKCRTMESKGISYERAFDTTRLHVVGRKSDINNNKTSVLNSHRSRPSKIGPTEIGPTNKRESNKTAANDFHDQSDVESGSSASSHDGRDVSPDTSGMHGTTPGDKRRPVDQESYPLSEDDITFGSPSWASFLAVCDKLRRMNLVFGECPDLAISKAYWWLRKNNILHPHLFLHWQDTDAFQSGCILYQVKEVSNEVYTHIKSGSCLNCSVTANTCVKCNIEVHEHDGRKCRDYEAIAPTCLECHRVVLNTEQSCCGLDNPAYSPPPTSITELKDRYYWYHRQT